MYGWTGKTLFIDLSRGKLVVGESSRENLKLYLGGRGIGSRILYESTSPDVDPYSPDNSLIFSVGPLVGTRFPGSGRYSVTAKSPLTGILGDANSGGYFGPELKYAGFDAVVIRGRAEKPVYIMIVDGEAEIRDASDLWGLDTWETEDRIRESTSPGVKVACIGPAGENLVRYAGIVNEKYRLAARTGVGAVMGSKRLKAVAVSGEGMVEAADIGRFEEVCDKASELIMEAPGYEYFSKYGTPSIVDRALLAGRISTRNRQTSIFPEGELLSAEELDSKYKVKDRACFACLIHCSNYARVMSGSKCVGGEGPEYETLVCLGSNCWNSDLASIIEMNELCNRLGLDTISTGGTIAWAMECYEKGIITREDTGGLDILWGDSEVMIELIKMIARREGFGDILAEGCARAARKFGEEASRYAMHVKGMELPAVEVRGAKGFGLGLAVASRGADHLRALVNFELIGYPPELGEKLYGSPDSVDPLSIRGKAPMVKYHEDLGAVLDSAIACKYTFFTFYTLSAELLAEALSHLTGVDFTVEKMMRVGERIVNLERHYNNLHGITRKDDQLPRRLLEEPLPEGRLKGQTVELEPMLDEYYKIRGWTSEGIVPKEKLLELEIKVKGER
ncbi:MAG TPA: aldehyde ferredoxin oxidoreductase [Candidatus Bathyarchaeota archaeon]|nr:aldehyde ferredoxin oxidoreductase [Candidatus Bathyarchaeota archaeon]